MSPQPAKRTSGGRAAPARSGAEWVTLGVSCLVLLVLVALILGQAVFGGSQPPAVRLRTEAVERRAGGLFYLPVRVTNTGDETAEAVQVLAELTVGGEVVEDGDQTIDFLSGGETHELEFVFTTDPATGTVDVRVASFQRP